MPDVYAGPLRVRIITSGRDGPAFSQDPDWLAAPDSFPVSLSMPLSGAAWGPERVAPWLMNLLPEGEPLRAITCALGMAAEDILGLLGAAGRDLAGALSMGTPQEGPGFAAIPDAAALERILGEPPSKPFLVGEDGVAMSLAGAQEKLPAAFSGSRLAIPVNGPHRPIS